MKVLCHLPRRNRLPATGYSNERISMGPIELLNDILADRKRRTGINVQRAEPLPGNGMLETALGTERNTLPSVAWVTTDRVDPLAEQFDQAGASERTSFGREHRESSDHRADD